MGKEKKKWYQTGEFEDGYQFGDGLRTLKNAIKKNIEALKTSNDDKVSQDKKETQIKKTNNVNSSLAKVEDGRLKIDPVVRLYGFENEVERQNYIKENPNLYALMGGYKYEPNVLSKNYTPLSEEGKKLVVEAQERDAYLHSLQYRIDKRNALNAKAKHSTGQALTDREIEAEQRFEWLNGSVTSEKLDESIEKAKAVNSAVTKFNNGEEINLSERLLLTENGGENYTNGDTYKTIDFLAVDNPENISAYENFKKAVEKEKSGKVLTEQEQADISNYITRESIRKSIVKDKYTLSDDIKENAENMNMIAATSLYNDAVYKKGIEKTLAQMELYTSTGMTRYFQDAINTGTIFLNESAYLRGWSDERASDALEDIPQNKYEIANNAVGQYFTRNDKKFSKFVQDTTVSMAYNVIPLALGGVSGGTSMVATGLSAFGRSYGEAAQLAPDAKEWQYWLYAGVNTASEVYMEKALSGEKNIFAKSGSEFSENMFKTLTKNVSNKTLLKSAYILSNSTGETFEETIQGLLSPALQEVILGADVVSILSTNRLEQRQALKNAIYDGLVGFASAGITTGTLGNDAVNSIERQRTIGAYYKKVFNELDVDVNNVAIYLKEISGGKNTDLYNSAEAVLNGDKSDSAIADMMLSGFERSREAQRLVYTKIGEQLNENNRYIAYGLIRQYDKLSRGGIELSQSIRDTYNELISTNEDTSRETFNYLVGKLSTTMDAVLPRASVTAEVVKKISNKIEEGELPRRTATRNDNKNNLMDEDAFVEGMWEDSPNGSKNNVEKERLESVENAKENGIIEETVDNDTGVPGEYTDEIVWQHRKVPVRKDGEGYRGKRTRQHDLRVDNYELKANPNNESYFLIHPNGIPVQFENMKNGIVQDCKLVMDKNSIYYVKEKIPILNKNILEQARRQFEAANLVGYRVEWLMSDKKAVDQMRQLFSENNLDIIVTYFPEQE